LYKVNITATIHTTTHILNEEKGNKCIPEGFWCEMVVNYIKYHEFVGLLVKINASLASENVGVIPTNVTAMFSHRTPELVSLYLKSNKFPL
jgi:hypothetical protein